MRLIDADALINDILTDYGCDPKYIADETIDGLKPYTDQLILERIGLQPTIAASPWRRVEDGLPPKATWVLTVATDGNVKLFNIATVDAGGQWWTCSPQNILRELYGVRYWMPIEPPKEDA